MRFSVPHILLPENDEDRNQFLHLYFCDKRTRSWKEGDNWIIETYWPPELDYYVDPAIATGLENWNPNYRVSELHTEVFSDNDFQLSLNDSWTLYAWSKWLSNFESNPEEVIILHVDYHNDLMSPRLHCTENGYVDILTDKPVNIRDATSVKDAILSSAIGVGSFMVPFLHEIKKVHVRHLCQGHLNAKMASVNGLQREFEDDKLLAIGKKRPKVAFLTNRGEASPITYLNTSNLDGWIKNLPNAPILLHIDMDYFNCRYDGDSDWQHHQPRFDPTFIEMQDQMKNVINAIKNAGLSKQVQDITIALSPAFFPSEFWAESIEIVGRLINEMKAS